MAKLLNKNVGVETPVEGVNKYGKRKAWDGENSNPEKFVSADDGLAVVNEKKFAMFNPKPRNPDNEEKSNAEESNGEDEGREENGEERQAEGQDEGLDPTPTKYKKIDYKKRYDDLKRHHDRKINELKQQMADLANSNGKAYTPPKSEEDLAKWKEEHPELYSIVETVSHMQSSKEMEQLQEKLKQLEERAIYEEAKAAYAELKALVPDVEKIRQSEDFHNWADEQPQIIQDIIYKNSTDVQAAAKVLQMYKMERMGRDEKPTPSKKPGADRQVNARSQAPNPTPKERIWKASEIKRLAATNWREYERLQDEIDRAWMEGRVDPTA